MDEYVTVTKEKQTGEDMATIIKNDIVLTIKGSLIYPEKGIIFQQLWFEIKNQRDIPILINPQRIYIKTCKNEKINSPILVDGIIKHKPINLLKGKTFNGLLSILLKRFDCKEAEIVFEEIKDAITGEVFTFTILYEVEKK